MTNDQKKRPLPVRRGLFGVTLKGSSYLPRRYCADRWELAPLPTSGLLWLHRARPSATLDKRNLQLSGGIVEFAPVVSRSSRARVGWPRMRKSKARKTMGKKIAVFALCAA